MTNKLNQEQQDIIKNWQNSFLGKSLATHTREYFHQHPLLKDIPDDAKQDLIADFYKKIFELSKSKEPLLSLRGYIATYVQSYAIFQVLCLTPEEKATSFHKNNPEISSELHAHIISLAHHNKEINALGQGSKNPKLSSQDLLTFCRIKTAICMFYMNGMNIVRCELKDRIKENDWLRPFIESMLIWEEDNCRTNIGLSSLITEKNGAQRHSTFYQHVSNGSRDPYTAWKNNDEILVSSP